MRRWSSAMRLAASPMKRMLRVLDIGKPADEIDHLAVGIDIERIDRQVAPFGIDLPVGAEGDLGMATVGLDVAAQRRHLERLAIDDQRHRAVLRCLSAPS